MSTTTATLQEVASVDEFLNVAATKTVPLFKDLSFDFLRDYDVFIPSKRRRIRVHRPPDLFCGFLHCYYENVYGTRPVTRELQDGLVWYYCRLDKPPSRDTIDHFLTDLEHVIDDIFDSAVYLHDDWEDNKLQDRDDGGTTTHNGETGYYQPEYTIDKSGITASSERIQIDGDGSDDGPRVHTNINIDLSEPLTVELTDVDIGGSGGSDQADVYIFMEQTANASFGNYEERYYVEIRDESDSPSLVKRDGNGDRTVSIENSGSITTVDVTVKRDSSGNSELFVDGSSQGAASDTEFTNPQFAVYSARSDGSVSIDEVKHF